MKIDPTVLRSKIGKQSAQAETRGMSVRKALRLATVRAGRGMGELVATLAGCQQSRADLAQVVTAVEGPQLLFLIGGPQDTRGLAIVDAVLVGGVVEYMTTGRVVHAPPEERAPSRTDAIMLGELLDRILMAMDKELLGSVNQPPVTGFRSSALLDDARAVGMALEDLPYHRFDLSIDLADGAKTGEMWLFFPKPVVATDADAGQQIKKWSDAWQAHVDRIPARIDAVLHKFSMPLDELQNLQVGSLIPVPAEQVGAVRLTGSDRNAVAIGKLGRAHGFRAVRIASQVDLQRVRAFAEVTTAIAPTGPQDLEPAGDALNEGLQTQALVETVSSGQEPEPELAGRAD
ncbi:MAG: FliM/FliN family flagellar motor switch protein [Marinosulfonomonas sp.]|nr:FliM/FliN family flagellar motor switch protein [Marinosulfonomonas sp.]